jgi:sensor histidine kinase YesM
MGRIKIKKKDSVLPFRETVAFRFILVAISGLFFMIALVQLIRSIQTGNTTLLVISIILTVGTFALTLFNMGQISQAKIPKSAQQRMKRSRR